MGLLDVVRSGVKIADKVTKPLQATVSFERCTAHDSYGAKVYGSGVVLLRALVDWTSKAVRTAAGELTVYRVTVTFLDVVALVAATPATSMSTAGLSDEDKITLPDGTTGPILDMSGFIDAGTGSPFATTVMMG